MNPIRIALPAKSSPRVERNVAIVHRMLRERFDVNLEVASTDIANVKLVIDPALGADRFSITSDETTTITVGDDRQCAAAFGNWLRGLRRDSDGLRYAGGDVDVTPECSIRGAYLANHFYNFYEAAPIEDVIHYIEELALLGYNTIGLIIPMFQVASFEDEAGRRSFERTNTLFREVRAIGLSACLLDNLNGGFYTAPKEIHAVPPRDDFGRRGWHGLQVCPSKPAGHAYLIETRIQLLDLFAETGIDSFVFWPYDEGGCGCEQCAPWGARGYLKLGREVAEIARAKYPGIKIILSTWMYDTPYDGEWEALSAEMEREPWLDAILADAHEDFPSYPLEHGSPGGISLINFPEISMWGQGPWGGFGANPLPGRFERLWNQARHILDGGLLYSEGIFEDLNKALYAGWYRNRDRSAESTLREYLAWETGVDADDALDTIVAAIHIMEQNHKRDEIGESAEEAYRLLGDVEARMSPGAAKRWRWRLLMLRATIDRELYRHGG
ncbi:MAG TPA: hypothetical protein ENN56_00565, partial [Firmicutes bacterium]|nr:hypothetical protein [Bacillota bacterium]